MGVFAEDGAGRFSLTPLAECLRSDVAVSQRALAIMSGEEHYQAWGELLYSVQTGNAAFEKLYGMPVFEFLSKNIEQAKVFDAAMVGVHGREAAAMTDAYDFSGITVVADIGGGNGSLLTTVLKKYPAMRGILYDLPGVTERARAKLQAQKQHIEKTRADLKAWGEQKKAETQALIRDWKAKREAKKLNARADRAEAYAEAAVAAALACINEAEEAIFEAALARMEADEAK
jgi:hypothetical protein